MKIALIGSGRWARNYISSLDNNPNLDLRSISLSSKNIVQVNSSVDVYEDWREQIKDDDYDGVIIATNPNIQSEIALNLAELNVPMILEKPIALSQSSLEKMRLSFEEYKPLILVNHFHLFHENFLRLCKMIDKAAIKNIEINDGAFGPFREDISSLYDWAPHGLGIIFYMFNEIITDLEVVREDGEINGDIWTIKSKVNANTDFSLVCGNGFSDKKRTIVFHFGETIDPIVFDLYSNNSIHVGDEIIEIPKLDKSPMDQLLNEFYDLYNKQNKGPHISLDTAFGAIQMLNSAKNSYDEI